MTDELRKININDLINPPKAWDKKVCFRSEFYSQESYLSHRKYKYSSISFISIRMYSLIMKIINR